MPAEAYHADPCKTPSLSRSIANTILTSSARRTWTEHPKLNPNYQPKKAKKHMDFGSVAHALMLNDGAEVRVIRSANFQGFAAQKARELAQAAGQIPILEADYARAKEMVAAGRAQLSEHENASDAFLVGKPEQTLIWKEKIDGTWIWLRIRPDWLPPLGGWLNDYKTTDVTSEPEGWTHRVLYPEGLDLQAAMYTRGYKAVFGVAPAGFRFVVQEVSEPYELSTVVLEPGDFDLAMRRVEKAMALWAWSMKHDKWPGHPARDCYVMRSGWREKAWIEREDREQADGAELRAKMLDWQAPISKKGKAA